MKRLFLVGLRIGVLIIALAEVSQSAPWRRTNRGWEKATWSVAAEVSRKPAKSAPSAWHRLHPLVLGTLQVGGSVLALLSLHTSAARHVTKAATQ